MKQQHDMENDNTPAGGGRCVVLSLDLGTQTGWAVRLGDGGITSGSENFKPTRFQGGGMRYLRFRQWLCELHQLTGHIERIYFEEVRRHLGVDAAHAYGGFLAHLCAWCEEKEIPYLGVPVQTIKKHITGKGNASKQMVIDAVRAKGFLPVDDNEADAISLLDFVLTQDNGFSGVKCAVTCMACTPRTKNALEQNCGRCRGR